jgi:hypothetical protein
MYGRSAVTEETGGSSPNPYAPKWGLLVGLLVAPVFFLFAYFGEPGRGEAAAIGLGILIFAAKVRWDLKREGWYWITIAIVLGCQTPLVLFIPWTNKSYPGLALLPIAVLDYALIWKAFKLVDRAVKRRASRIR